MSFVTELKRRNVFKVGTAYLIVAWLLIQVADAVLPTFDAPEWVIQTITFVLILGFPVAVLLAWAFEITPSGITKTKRIPLEDSITHITGQKLNYLVTGLLAIAVGVLVADNYLFQDTDAGLTVENSAPTVVDTLPSSPGQVVDDVATDVLPNSVAVLPLENLSPDPDNAYFAAGIHEEILNHLAKIRNLNVISRTSMIRYADSDLTIPEIAAQLNVETVMEGSVRYADNRVLVTMQLIDPATDVHLWSESYNRDFSDVFAIQADIAMNVANALEAEFSLSEQKSIEAVPTTSPAAYALYLRAASVGTGSGSGIAAIRYLDRAISLDPNFALAYAVKAANYANPLTGNVPDQQAEFEQGAQDNAERALALDPTLGLPHVALAFVHQAHWRWDEAEQELEQALRLAPNDSYILSQYSRTERYRGKYDEAVEAGRRGIQLDPQNVPSLYQLGINYRYARNYDAAALSFQRAAELVPSAGNIHAQLGFTEISRGNSAVALEELQIAEELFGDSLASIRIVQLAAGYAQLGRRDEVERLVSALESRAENSPVNAALWALMYIALEDYDQALESLEVAVDDQAPDLVPLGEIKANPYAIPALDEPRFQQLRDRIGT